MSRNEAIALVSKYDGSCSEATIESFCKYINITGKEFWEIVEGFVNKDLFEKTNNGKWEKKFEIF
jgi:hypothetical protein